MTRAPGHRQTLTPMQAALLAKPVRFERLPHNPDAIYISTRKEAR